MSKSSMTFSIKYDKKNYDIFYDSNGDPFIYCIVKNASEKCYIIKKVPNEPNIIKILNLSTNKYVDSDGPIGIRIRQEIPLINEALNNYKLKQSNITKNTQKLSLKGDHKVSKQASIKKIVPVRSKVPKAVMEGSEDELSDDSDSSDSSDDSDSSDSSSDEETIVKDSDEKKLFERRKDDNELDALTSNNISNLRPETVLNYVLMSSDPGDLTRHMLEHLDLLPEDARAKYKPILMEIMNSSSTKVEKIDDSYITGKKSIKTSKQATSSLSDQDKLLLKKYESHVYEREKLKKDQYDRLVKLLTDKGLVKEMADIETNFLMGDPSLSFGSNSLQSNRRKSKPVKKGSNKKFRGSRSVIDIFDTEVKTILKNNKKSVSVKKKKKDKLQNASSNFGLIYGLQNSPGYSGVFPMSQGFMPKGYPGDPIQAKQIFPTLENIVERDYSLKGSATTGPYTGPGSKFGSPMNLRRGF